jgi:hypothetical protein
MLRRLNSRSLQIGALGVALVLSAKPGAGAEPNKAKIKACGVTFRSAVQLEQSGHLRQAKDMLLACMKPACGGVKLRCTALFSQLEADTPSVVPLVVDEGGDPRVDVQVTMDNELLTSRLDGRALPVDPGLHEFSFSADGSVLASQKVMIVQGQRNRPINVALRGSDKHGKKAVLSAGPPAAGVDAKASLEKPPVDPQALEKTDKDSAPEKSAPVEKASADKTSPDPSSSDTPPVETKSKGGPGAAPYLIGVVGLAGLGAYGAFTYWGRKDNELLGSCSPNCSTDSVNHIRKLYLGADIAGGIGAAALATSLIWFIASPSSKEKAPSQASYRVDVQPSPSGGYASVSGSF